MWTESWCGKQPNSCSEFVTNSWKTSMRRKQTMPTNQQMKTAKMTEHLSGLTRRMRPKAQRLFFREIYTQVASGKYPSVVNELYRADYRWKPVDVRAFLLDAEYLGA